MKSNKKVSLIISFVLLAGMLLIFGSSALANPVKAKVPGAQPLENSLNQLVKEGVLTKEKSAEVKSYLGEKCRQWKKTHEEMIKLSPEERKAKIEKWQSNNKNHKHGGYTNQLVEDKILTQKQADALKAKLRDNLWQQKKQHISTGLNSLVAKGILNQQQADKVLKQLEQTRAERIELFEQTKNMSPEERHIFFAENKAKIKSPIEQLIKDGVLNKEQAEAIREILPYHKAHGKFKH